MYSNGLNLNASSYQSVFASTGGSLAVPVKPSALIYAHFDHVHGIEASHGEKGVSVNKLRILNTLIDQLSSMKKSALPQETAENLSMEEQDYLIDKYSQQINNTIKTAPYGLAGAMPETGALLSIEL